MPVFSLKEIRSLQVQNISEGNFKYWNESAIYGYYGGGQPTYRALISRLDFFNETVSDPGNNLPSARGERLAATSSSSYGYFGGGFNTPGNINTISRLDFSNETVSDPGKNLPSARRLLTATSSNSYGYFGGGFDGANINTISRLDFSNETVSDPGKNLPSARTRPAALSSNSYGYFGGGYSGSFINTITRLDFSNETVSDPGKNLPSARLDLAATSSNSYGYFGGGTTPARINIISRLDFSNETVSDPGKNLPTATSGLAATSSSSYGYFGGGYIPGATNDIQRLDFSNETVSDPGNNLPTTVAEHAALSGGASVYRNSRGYGTYGYFGGGYTGLPAPSPFDKSFVFRFDFSTEGFTPIGNLSSNRYGAAGFSNKDNGYFAGGTFLPGISYTASVDKISFSNETVSTSSPTSFLRGFSTGLSSKYCGYLAGGLSSSSPQISSNITKFDYSNGSNISLGLILLSRTSSSATVDSLSYGYISTPLSCSIQRLDFSSETVSDPGNNLPYASRSNGGISYTSYGYFVGGSNPEGDPATYYNTISRIDFSSETTSLPGKNLPSVRRNIATTQSGSYGYCVGGEKPDYPPPPVLSTSEISTISRIDFSTEDVTNIATNFPQNVSHSAGISNHNKYNLYS